MSQAVVSNTIMHKKFTVVNFIIFLLIFSYYSLPRIDLFYPFSGVPTGVRAADFSAILMLFILVFYNYQGRIRFKNKPLIFAFFIILYFLHLFSSYFGGGVLKAVIGSVRIFEYIVVGYFVYFMREVAKPALLSALAIHILFSILQFLLWVPNFNPGRGDLYSREFSGLLGTPGDLSFFIGLVFLITAVGKYKRTLMYIVVLVNGVKSAILFLPILLAAHRIKLLLFFGFLFSLVVLGYFYHDLKVFFEAVVEASKNGTSYDNIKYYTKLDVAESTLGSRVGKWGGALGIWLSSWNYFFLGYGGYSAGGAMDGGVVRLLFEYGLSSVILIALLSIRAGFLFFSVFIVCNLFVDGYVSSIISPLLVTLYFFEKNRE
jgi:hypothetical protein